MLLGGGYMVVLLVLILSIVKGMEINIFVLLIYKIKNYMILNMDFKKKKDGFIFGMNILGLRLVIGGYDSCCVIFCIFL